MSVVIVLLVEQDQKVDDAQQAEAPLLTSIVLVVMVAVLRLPLLLASSLTEVRSSSLPRYPSKASSEPVWLPRPLQPKPNYYPTSEAPFCPG